MTLLTRADFTTRDTDGMARGAEPFGFLPEPGQRCPRCHHRAPRADDIPCLWCSPYLSISITIGEPVSRREYDWPGMRIIGLPADVETNELLAAALYAYTLANKP